MERKTFVLGWVENIADTEENAVTSIFSFSHNVLKGLLSQGCENLVHNPGSYSSVKQRDTVMDRQKTS